jgi:hypothetical protein
VITLIDMTAHFCRTANLDRPHGTEMTKRHLVAMNLSIGRPKSPEDISYL